MDLVCWLGSWHNISTSLSILVSGLCTLYRNFCCIFSCYLRSTKPGIRYLYSCSYTDTVCSVIEVSSVQRTQQSGCLLPQLWTETDPDSETLCSLDLRIPDDG
jgi:hypothetical protein